jgi:NADPH:quinone reductase-like Zn-dependent oxidoreductase
VRSCQKKRLSPLAWNALTGGKGLCPGETVLTLSSGGVSLFALQLAKTCGARVIATTSDEQKAQRLSSLGADHVIDYRKQTDRHGAVRDLTGGRGVDHIIEVGGGRTLERSIKSTALEGEIALVGWLANHEQTAIDIRVIAASVVTLRRVAVGSRAQFLALTRAIAVSRLEPVIDRVFALDDAVEAFRYYEAGRYFGEGDYQPELKRLIELSRESS